MEDEKLREVGRQHYLKHSIKLRFYSQDTEDQVRLKYAGTFEMISY